jgi:hypothetical protein
MDWRQARLGVAGAIVAGVLIGGRAAAHHSIAGLFDERQTVQIAGVLTGFRFHEPHGLISVAITNRRGRDETWRAETNGRMLLGRVGWTESSLRVGESVTVEGFPATGGAKRLRVRKVIRADGSVLFDTAPE